MRRWRTTYLIVANTALLIVALQWGSHAAILGVQGIQKWTPTYPPAEYAVSALPELTTSEVRDLWRVTTRLPYRFAGGAGFLHAQTTSRFVNIDQYGIRSNGNGARSVDVLDGGIWLFGGSTAFGFGVPDQETIPAHLERMTGSPAINLAVRGHSTAMENRLFRFYLRAGYKPRQAIFLDGVNEVCDPDLFSAQMRLLTDRAQDGYRWEFGEPVVHAVKGLAGWLWRDHRSEREDGPERSLSCNDHGRRNELRDIVGRLLAERQMLCQLDGIECWTFIPPIGGVHGKHEDQRFLASHEALELQRLFAHLEPTWKAAGATFVTEALAGADSGSWVDEINYSPAGNRAVAAAIARYLRQRGRQ